MNPNENNNAVPPVNTTGLPNTVPTGDMNMNMAPNFNPPMGPNPNPNMNMAPNMMPPAPQPKKPMDPKTKKTIIIVSACVGGAALIGIALAIILPIILHVDYAEAYLTAKDLKSEISSIYHNNACENVESYAGANYISNKDYATYVENCRTLGSDSKVLVEQLGKSQGVQRNPEIKKQYDAFKASYDATVTSGEDKSATLDKYKVWHEWSVATRDLDSWDETDADLTSAANILIKSDNATFKKYGEGWLERRKAAAAAYRAYYAASYSDPNKSGLRVAMQDRQSEYNNWVSENKPSVSDFGQVATADASKMRSEYGQLYELISAAYAANYNYGSGDCWEIGGVVTCD